MSDCGSGGGCDGSGTPPYLPRLNQRQEWPRKERSESLPDSPATPPTEISTDSSSTEAPSQGIESDMGPDGNKLVLGLLLGLGAIAFVLFVFVGVSAEDSSDSSTLPAITRIG